MTQPAPIPARNPGPRFGYELLDFADRILPRPLFHAGLRCGAAMATLLMPRQRRASRAFLRAATGRTPAWHASILHFEMFARMLAERLRLARGIRPRFRFAPQAPAADFESLCRSAQPALFGTFHVGQSDLLGCMLGDFGRRIALVRNKVGNALDSEYIEKYFAPAVKILWINEKEGFLLAMKEALEQGWSVGLQCDRVGFGGRPREFEFFGAARLFPFTIYHLAALLLIPVGFAFAGDREADGTIPVVAAPVFRPADHRDPLDAAREHFRAVLDLLEGYLRRHPLLWFNFGDARPHAPQ